MEFFAFIGLITVAWIIYDFTKYVVIDYPQQEEEEKQRMLNDVKDEMLPDEFVFKRSDDMLCERVFEPLDYNRNEVVAPMNRSLKKIGAYTRLYYHLLSVYDEFMDEDTEVRMAVYRIEMLRRDIQDKLAADSNELNSNLGSIANTIMTCGEPIIKTYERERDYCLAKNFSSKVEQLNRIYSILDAEKLLFRGYPETNAYYATLGETYLSKVFDTDEQAKEAIRGLKRRQYQHQNTTASYLAQRGR